MAFIATWLCLFFVHRSSGYIFRVNSESSGKGVCLTDELYSAIAPIQTLNRNLKTSSENGWLASVNESLSEFDCIPNVHCNNWKYDNDKIPGNESNLANDFGLIKNRPWNYFPEFKTDGSRAFLQAIPLNLDAFKLFGRVELSILGEEVQIVLTSDDNWENKPGIIIHLGNNSWIAACSKVTKDVHSADCINSTLGRSQNSLMSGRQWIHLGIKVIKNNNFLSFNGKFNESVNLGRRINTVFKYITFRSKQKPALIKLHKYQVFRLSQERAFEFKRNSNDLNRALGPKTIAFTFANQLNNEQKVKVNGIDVPTTSSSRGGWKIISADLAQAYSSNDKINNISLPNNGRRTLVSIESASTGHREFYIEGHLEACQVIETGEYTRNFKNDTIRDNFLPGFSFDNICTKLKAPNCSGVEACSPSGCFCFSGHARSTDGKCTKECDNNHFGPNCVREIIGGCQKGNYNMHTGCSKCIKTARPPDCSKSVSVFQVAPQIVATGMNSVTISIENAVNKMSKEDKEHFVRGELRLLQHKSNKEVKSFNLSSVHVYNFLALSEDTNYNVTLMFFEANDLHNLEKSPTVSFKTHICTPISQHNVKMESNSSHVIVYKTVGDVCNGLYRISNVSNKEAKIGNAINIETLKKFRNYTLKFYEGSNSLKEITGVSFPLKISRTEKSFPETLVAVKNLTLEERKEEVYFGGLKSKTLYSIKAAIIDVDHRGTLEVERVCASFHTKKCITPDNSDIDVSKNETFVLIKFLKDEMNICNFSLQIKTSDGLVDVLEWERSNYTYTLQNVPNDAQSITMKFSKGESLEFSLKLKLIDAVYWTVAICVVLSVLLLAIFLVWRFKYYKHTLQYCKKNGSKGQDLDLVPLPEAPARTLEYEDYKKCSLISVRDFETYLERAKQLDLFNQQHGTFKKGRTQPWNEGVLPENKSKNRYNDLAAYDATRVHLPLFPIDNAKTDYINANYVDGYKRPKAYIATQGPKPQTVDDFWRMVWHEKVTLIVMVANVTENGKKKCEQYWPDFNSSNDYDNVRVQNTAEDIFADFVVRSLRATSEGHTRLISHLHYTAWPDHGVPQYPQSLANFSRKILDNESKAPVTVHCSAGVGRTGTIILIDACLRMALDEGALDPFKLLQVMRNQRANLVDNAQQYEFVHLVLLEILVVPKFSVTCGDFPSTFNILMAQNKKQFKNQYMQIESVTQKDWKRAQAGVDTEDGYLRIESRNKKMVSAFPSLVRLFPDPITNQKMVSMNAVYVDGFRRKKQFIITEVPDANNVGLFWCMIKQNQIQQIIVLNEPAPDEAEFLPEQDEKLIYNGITVVYLREFYLKNSKIITCGLEDGRDRKMINIVKLTGWPAKKNLGSCVDSLVELWEETEKARAEGLSIIMCHDGATASGLFVAMGFVLEKIKLEKVVDVSLAVRTLRQIRPSFITDIAQFEAIYRSALTYLQAYDTYGNFQ